MRRRPTTSGVNTYYTYGLTISPTKNPTKVPYWELWPMLKDFLKTFDATFIEHAWELKTKTDVVHLHVSVRFNQKVTSYFPIKNRYPGWQFFLVPKFTRALELSWHYYLNKESHFPYDLKLQSLTEHEARNTYMFLPDPEPEPAKCWSCFFTGETCEHPNYNYN